VVRDSFSSLADPRRQEIGMSDRKKIEGELFAAFAKILLALAAAQRKQDPWAKLLRELSEEFPESPLYAAEYAKAMGRPIRRSCVLSFFCAFHPHRVSSNNHCILWNGLESRSVVDVRSVPAEVVKGVQ